MLVAHDKCTGCNACIAVCPKKCIKMKIDREGFSHPYIDEKSCIQCYLCERTCPVLCDEIIEHQVICKGVQNVDDELRLSSTSGGVFISLANFVLKKNGYISGAIYDQNQTVKHIVTNHIYDVYLMQGAKYAQSDLGNCFNEIKQHLDNGELMLFVGMPCQVGGLLSYLRKKYDNLITVDMLCFGVPSPKVFKQYLTEKSIAEFGDTNINSINLRNKESGWSNYSYSVQIENKDGRKYFTKQENDLYMKGFVNSLYLRPSCHDCQFKGISRISDFTLGDYWGVWNQYPEFDDNKGTSLLIIQSNKGMNIWNIIKDDFKFIDISIEEAIEYNKSAVNSAMPHAKRDEFFGRLNNQEMLIDLLSEYLVPKERKESIFTRIIRRIRR